jgi:proteic killer suppression protein
VIKSFRSKETAALFKGETCPKFRNIERVAQRKLKQLDAAVSLDDLKIFPGNRLEPLKGNRKGQWCIRINDQWRICFVWQDANAYDVEIVDYH